MHAPGFDALVHHGLGFQGLGFGVHEVLRTYTSRMMPRGGGCGGWIRVERGEQSGRASGRRVQLATSQNAVS